MPSILDSSTRTPRKPDLESMSIIIINIAECLSELDGHMGTLNCFSEEFSNASPDSINNDTDRLLKALVHFRFSRLVADNHIITRNEIDGSVRTRLFRHTEKLESTLLLLSNHLVPWTHETDHSSFFDQFTLWSNDLKALLGSCCLSLPRGLIS
ncbi:hypothetical protein PGTUg99_029895 [Puccinia graminis f. sp. tritici]|uniref:Uncharacterized protein n=1 Tax=Puccinia graminis f. sp. tritici TaxID=56615 RepID=A0A5B0RVE4_PUCGR|nr:hypothetical protein PGTUg99_029895 [Puccinia graminis f. sp. tritici]